ncbi:MULTISPECIES: DUF2271 domain-containing protein [Cellulophaga]|uniref:DUF2271 domain-containing protein n=1 Tax=Cellulophaga TaxID=104264 RepID=UPI000B5C8BA4|nr:MULTISPECIES: DUF2271 domain-containing protein [Cellulophaga]TVZ10617.1 uncharacterized protein DUF2271 [Cellulophaga sp. RHA_52]SNQ43644.1 Conserved hypothetical periplasmic protein [Cellulophaga lytica]
MKFKVVIIAIVGLFTMAAFTTAPKTSQYKCMIQLKNYEGEGAYVVVSLLDAEGKYVETLNVLGDDPEWYHDLTKWYSFFENKKPSIDAITGATISGGERAIKVIKIDDDKIDSGYKIRFETAVEDQKYVEDDVTFELTSASVNSKVDGTGYIRYIRMLPQK